MRRRLLLRSIAPVLVVLLAALTYLRFEQPLFPQYGKGGVASIKPDAYVVTTSRGNRIIWKQLQWTGKSRLQNESAIWNGHEVAPMHFTGRIHEQSANTAL
jgi:hypothetical protein